MSSHRMEIRVRPRRDLPVAGGEGGPAPSEPTVGTLLYFDLEAPSPEAAAEAAEALCRRILANPVFEDFDVFPAGRGTGAGP